jgi:subtilisin-like proprotein convertase family protein
MLKSATQTRFNPSFFAFLALLAILSASSASALIYSYENTTTGTVSFVSSDANCDSGGAGSLSRTFTVGDSFTVAQIALGLNISHNTRGDLRVRLISPTGTAANFIVQDLGDNANDYDIFMSTNTEGTLDDGDDDFTDEPFMTRIVTVAGANFFTGNSAGTWTLRLCDRDNNGTNGTFNRALLVLSSAQAVTVTGTSFISPDWGSNGNNTAVTTLTSGGVTITQGATNNWNSSGELNTGLTYGLNFRTNTSQLGNHTGFYNLYMGTEEPADGEQKGEQTFFSFSVPVRDLQFSYLDVDFLTGDFEDQYRVIGFDASGNRVPYVITEGTAHDLAGDIVEADTSATDTTGTNGNASVRFSGAVSTLQIVYSNGDDPADGNDISDQWTGLSDFSFVAYDYGDDPSTYGIAANVLGNRTTYLGTNPPDGESANQPGVSATTDDTTQVSGVDDEDARSTLPNFTTGSSTYAVPLRVQTDGTATTVTVCGWIDWNRDGNFGTGVTPDSNEGACMTVNSTNCTSLGSNAFTCNVTFTVPAGGPGNTATFARFRVGQGATAMTTGSFATVSDQPGEVEDYPIGAGTLPVTVAFAEASANGISWTTSSETANVGFRVVARAKGSKEWTEVARLASDSLDSATPRSYAVNFDQRLAEGTAIAIEEIDVNGKARRHGPFAIGKSWGERPVAHRVDWNEVEAELESTRPAAREALEAGTTDARILVAKRGIQRLSHAALIAAGVDLTGTPVANIALFDEGRSVARYIGPVSSSSKVQAWSSESFIEFIFEPKLTLASPYDALELRVRPGSANIARSTFAPSAGDLSLAQVKADFTKNRQYSAGSPNGDPWFDERVLAFNAPATLSRTFDLPNLVNGSAALSLNLWGVTNWPGSTPDHHLVVRLNGEQLESSLFDGLTTWNRTYDVSNRVAAQGNVLEISLPLDTGYAFDLVHLEGFSVSYTQNPTAEGGRLTGAIKSKGAWRANGFTEATVSSWASGARAELAVDATGGVWAPGVFGTFDLAQPSAQEQPKVVAGIPLVTRRPSADYLIVTHADLAGSIDGLVGLEQSRGYAVEVATTEAIYARYSDHAPSAEAIRTYIGASDKRLKFVLLVGAESYDPYDYLGLGSISYVPTSYSRFNEFVAFGPSDDVLADRTGDRVADYAIGRLPVRTPSELAAVVDKLVSWQGRAPSKNALVVAGKSGGDGISLSDIGASHAKALGIWAKQTAFVDDSSTTVVRDQILTAMNSGTPLISYVGHSSYGQLDSTPVLRWEDVASLTNVGQSNLVAQWGCWNAYFPSPEVETISNRLLLTPHVGATAVIGSTALTSTQSHQALGEAFLQRVAGGDATVGQALLAAKQQLAASNPSALDAVLGQALLGDPATPLPR